MALTPARHDVGGGSSHKSVTIRKEWSDIIAEAKSKKAEHYNARHWTEEENAFLIEARSGKVVMDWKDIGAVMKCTETTARKQWRKLQK